MKVPSIVKGLGVSDMDSVSRSGSGSPVVPLEVCCGEGPADGS